MDFPTLTQTMTALGITAPIQKAVINRLNAEWGTLPPRYNPNRTNSIAGQAIAPLVSCTNSAAIRSVKSKIVEIIQQQYEVTPCR